METKKVHLDYVASLARHHALTLDEVVAAYKAGNPAAALEAMPATPLPPKKEGGHAWNIGEVLSYVGAFVIFLGVSIVIAQSWETLSGFSKLLATLGVGIASYVTGVLLQRQAGNPALVKTGTAFHLIAGLVMPLGLYALVQAWQLDAQSPTVLAIIFFTLFAFYLASLKYLKGDIFLVFSILYGTGLYFALVDLTLQRGAPYDSGTYYLYAMAGAGLSYLFLGTGLSRLGKDGMVGFLHSFGLIFLLSATLLLDRFSFSENGATSGFWTFVYPAIIFAVFYYSVRLKSRAFLVFGALYLMAYILKITAQYFSQALGWPFTLMLCGLALIAIGYYSAYVNKRYITA